MQLILRKNDSATSLLLFVFNNYMTKTTKDYMKLSSLLEIMKVFGKNETTIRMSLSRAAKAGLLTNNKQGNEVYYTLTPEGRESVILWNEGVIHFWKRYQLRNSKWDKKWYFINVDFKDDKKEKKAEFLDKLQQFGLVQINTNTWITPYHQYEEIWKLIDEYDLTQDIVEIYGELKIHKDLECFLDEVYDISKLIIRYRGFIDTYGQKLEEIRPLYKEKSFINSGLSIPILHELGWNFFEIATDDAVLPKQILPEWEGDKAAHIMKELRELLLEAAYKYLEKFD